MLAAKVLAKSMDSTAPDANKFEIQVLTKNEHGVLVQKKVEGEELARILDEAKVFEESKDNNKK